MARFFFRFVSRLFRQPLRAHDFALDPLRSGPFRGDPRARFVVTRWVPSMRWYVPSGPNIKILDCDASNACNLDA